MQDPCFKFLTLDKTQFWKILLFKDQHNYAGIRHKIKSAPNVRNIVTQHWNIVEFLPVAVEKIF